jgi:two-component system, cell cycle response regulator
MDAGPLILLVDDNHEYLRSTERILKRAGHQVITAGGPREGLEIARTQPVELILVDFMMPEMNGDAFVKELRTFNKTVQVILQTGFAAELPPAAMLKKLDVQGYHDKSDGPYKLLLWTDVGLQAARTVRRLEQIRSGLSHILEVARQSESFDELLQGILQQADGLLGAGESCIVVRDRDELLIAAALGTFRRGERLADHLDGERIAAIQKGIRDKQPTVVEGCFLLPLHVVGLDLGIVHLEQPTTDSIDLQLIELFAHHASIAIHSAKLNETVAVDGATGVYTKRFFEHALLRELRLSHRTRQPVSVVKVGYGKEERAEQVSALIRQSTRATDVVGHWSADEFAVVLPNTDADGADVVVRRIARGFANANLSAAHIGCAALSPPPDDSQLSLSEHYLEAVASRVLSVQDAALSLEWPPIGR